MILSCAHAHGPEIPSPLTWRKSHTLAMASEITGSVSLLTTCLNCFLSCPQDSMQLDYYFVPIPVAVPGYLLTQLPTASQEPYCKDSASLLQRQACDGHPTFLHPSHPQLSARPDVTHLSHFMTAHPHLLRAEISRGLWYFSVLDGFTSMS